MWVCAERSAASSHADSGVPVNRPLSPWWVTTMQRACLGMVTAAPARSMTFLTAVHLCPMIFGLVMMAASQWKKLRTSGPLTPGKRYLLPPEKPTTSWGKTGPTIKI